MMNNDIEEKNSVDPTNENGDNEDSKVRPAVDDIVILSEIESKHPVFSVDIISPLEILR